MILERIMCRKRAISLDVQLPVPCTEEEAADGNIEKSEDSTTGCNDKNSRVSKEYNTTEIFVSYLPEVTNERIKDFFAKFGDVTFLEMYVLEWDIYKNLDRFNSEGPKSCLVKFSDTSAVAKVMERKRRLFLNVNGKKHRLKVTTTDCVNNILTPEKEKIARKFVRQADMGCKGNNKRNATFEFVRKAFYKTSDPVVLQYITRRMTIAAATRGTLESLKYCIEKGVDVNLCQLYSHQVFPMCSVSIIFFTVLDKDKKIGYEKMKFLVESGADIHIKNDVGSLLHVSVRHGSDEMLKFFLENGLDVNLRDKQGATPLLLALKCRTIKGFLIEKVKLLFDYGADMDIRDQYGQTPCDFLRDKPRECWDQIKEIFKKHNPNLKICPKRVRACVEKDRERRRLTLNNINHHL